MASDPPRKTRIRHLDVRTLIANGEEPFPHVMALVQATGPGEGFTLVTPFIPAPLIERLQSEGYAVRPAARGDGTWETHFQRPAG